MPHFPKPFYRKPRRHWYVEIHGKQIDLGPEGFNDRVMALVQKTEDASMLSRSGAPRAVRVSRSAGV